MCDSSRPDSVVAACCSDVSPKEKLVGYIIKNPPEDKMSKAEKK